MIVITDFKGTDIEEDVTIKLELVTLMQTTFGMLTYAK